MGTYKEVDGDLIKLAQQGEFEVIGHGCNTFLAMGSGIAPQIARAFPAAEEADNQTLRGDVNKLGNFTYAECMTDDKQLLYVVNIYSQYKPGSPGPGRYDIPLDYDALVLALRKINFMMVEEELQTIGLPRIGCGLAGGNWEVVQAIIQEELCDVDVTIVNYKQ